MAENQARLAIFDTFKTKGLELTGEAKRQRSIIVILASKKNPVDRTRTAISQNIAKGQGILWKNIYSGIFRDMDEVLLPLGLVQEEGRLPLTRGPKALQEKGIPFYRLTTSGLLVALSIKEVPNRAYILSSFFEFEESQEKQMVKLAEATPTLVFSIFEKYVKAYCNGDFDSLLPFDILRLRDSSEESFIILKEMLVAFPNLSKKEREDTLELLNKISG